MALEQKLSLKLAQKLVMTPSLQQAIKLLQMTRMELETLLTQELVENPVLEETGDITEGERAPREEERSDAPSKREAAGREPRPRGDRRHHRGGDAAARGRADRGPDERRGDHPRRVDGEHRP